jgi:hypothetical protein
MSRAAKYFWSDGYLNITSDEFMFSYCFCSWFINKSIAFGIRKVTFNLILFNKTVETMFAVVQPSNISLFILEDNSRIQDICCMYECKFYLTNSIYIDFLVDKILYPDNTTDIAADPTEQLIRSFQRVSNYLNVIPYFKGIEQLPDTTFTKMDTLFLLKYNDVSLDFLNRELFQTSIFIYISVWEQRQWPVTKIVIEGDGLDCRLFGRLR